MISRTQHDTDAEESRLDGAHAQFADPGLLDLLETAASQGGYSAFDKFAFGVITMDRVGFVQHYNANESARSGLSPSRVIGRNFFEHVGPCTNNYLVAERFHAAAAELSGLDETLDFVFTFVMRPTAVRLRLLAAPGSVRQYLLVENR